MPAPSVGLTPEGRMDFWFKPFERLRPGQGGRAGDHSPGIF